VPSGTIFPSEVRKRGSAPRELQRAAAAVLTEPSLSKVSVSKLLLMATLMLLDLEAWPTGRIWSGKVLVARPTLRFGVPRAGLGVDISPIPRRVGRSSDSLRHQGGTVQIGRVTDTPFRARMAKCLLNASSCDDARATRSEVLLLKALTKWRFRAPSVLHPE